MLSSSFKLRHAHEEKVEAIHLLKALVADNETLTQCIMGQQHVIEQQRNDLAITQQDLQVGSAQACISLCNEHCCVIAIENYWSLHSWLYFYLAY